MFQLFKPNLQKGPFYVRIFMGLKERQIKKKSYHFHSRARLNHLHSRLSRRSVSSQKHICCSCMPPVLIGIHLKKVEQT